MQYLHGGWKGGSTDYDDVDAFNKSLTKTTATTLSQKRSDMFSIAIEDYAIFAGRTNNERFSNT